MLKCNLRLTEMRAGAGFYTAAPGQRGCVRTEPPRTEVGPVRRESIGTCH